MKKIFLITVVLMLTTPAWAVTIVTITAEPNLAGDANEVLISYAVTPTPASCEDGNRPRAFGLNVTVSDGNIVAIDDYFEGIECDDVNKGYGIFPGRIEITGNAVTSVGNPLAREGDPGAENTGLDTNTVVLEMGSLYVDGNCPPDTGILCMLRVSLDCDVNIVGNAARTGSFSPTGVGVVLENLEPLEEYQVVYVGTTVENVTVFVPDIVGMTYDQAKTALVAEDLAIGDLVWECSSVADFNSVISQFPLAGAGVPAESEIDIVRSLGACDWGDANDPTYPTLKKNNGAVHQIVEGVYLGPGPQATSIDAELDGQPNADATLDDTTGPSADDEDGVVISGGTGLIAKGAINTAAVTASVAGYLNAWLDKNADGHWDASEQIFTDEPLAAGLNNLTFTVSCDANSGPTVSRWRYTTYDTDEDLSYEGEAVDGEVEDHAVEIVCHVPYVVDMTMADANATLEAACFNVGEITYECNDVIADGNVISTDPAYCNYPECATDVNYVVSTGPCPAEDCMAATNPAYDDWVYWNKPDCWCYPRQCRGDIDGLKQGPFWVSTNDIIIFRTAVNTLEFQIPAGGICADIDHMKQGPFWVSTNDMVIFRLYVNKLETSVPVCSGPGSGNDEDPLPNSEYNFWCAPPGCP